jgi:ribonuclease HI
MTETVIIHTDGVTNRALVAGRHSAIWRQDYELCGGAETTNNKMEDRGHREALTLTRSRHRQPYTDTICQKRRAELDEGLKKNGWKTADSMVKNSELWQCWTKISATPSTGAVIKGHAGHDSTSVPTSYNGMVPFKAAARRVWAAGA